MRARGAWQGTRDSAMSRGARECDPGEMTVPVHQFDRELEPSAGLTLNEDPSHHMSIPHEGTRNWLAEPVLLVTAWR
jgi:hypothetical protein